MATRECPSEVGRCRAELDRVEVRGEDLRDGRLRRLLEHKGMIIFKSIRSTFYATLLSRIVNRLFIWYQLLNELAISGRGKKVKTWVAGYGKTQSREIMRYLPRPRGVDLGGLVLDSER
jgi:pyridoxine/pyridoxamine 5'-phosphate oxidase